MESLPCKITITNLFIIMDTPTTNATQSGHTLQISQQELDKIANNGSGSINFGPLTLMWNFSLNPLDLSGSASLLGVNIGSVDLNLSNPTATLGDSVAGFTAEVTLTLNPSAPSLDYHVVISTPFGPVLDKSGSISL